MVPCGFILDFDDTIMATRKRRLDLLSNTLAEMGHHIEKRHVDANWGKPFRELVLSIAPKVNYEDFCELYAARMRLHPPELTPGCRELLDSLMGRAVFYVLSSGSRSLVIQDLKSAGILDKLSQVWCCEDTKFHKPDSRVIDPIIEVFESIGGRKEDLLYIGDSLMDLQVAEGRQVKFVAVLTGMTTQEEFKAAGLPGENIYSGLDKILDRARSRCQRE